MAILLGLAMQLSCKVPSFRVYLPARSACQISCGKVALKLPLVVQEVIHHLSFLQLRPCAASTEGYRGLSHSFEQSIFQPTFKQAFLIRVCVFCPTSWTAYPYQPFEHLYRKKKRYRHARCICKFLTFYPCDTTQAIACNLGPPT